MKKNGLGSVSSCSVSYLGVFKMGKHKLANRDRFQVAYEVLVCCMERPLMSSNISRNANLSNLIMPVLDGLVSAGLLVTQKVGGRTLYRTSHLGRLYLVKFDDLSGMIKPILLVSKG